MKWLIDFCALLKWFIIGGKRPDVVLNKRKKIKRSYKIFFISQALFYEENLSSYYFHLLFQL